MNRPLGEYHEWITAHTLIALENLESQGVWKHKFRIIQTYPNENDKYVWWATTRIMDMNGNSFYTTYPPFSLILAFIVHKILFLKFSVLSIQLFNAFLHLLGAIFMYLLVYELTKTKSKVLAPLISSSLYLFISPNLWYFSNIYSWDTIWHHIGIIFLYFLTIILKKIEDHLSISNRLIFLFSLVNFILIYTELQGLFFSVPTIILLIFQKSKYRKKILLSLILSTLLALLTILIQYGTITGIENYLQIMVHKFFNEYGTFGSCERGCDILALISIYNHLYGYLFFPLIFLFDVMFFTNIRSNTVIITKNEFIILHLALFTVIVHHYALLGDVLFHDFNTLKFSIFICILFGILISKIRVDSSLEKILLFGSVGYIILSLSFSIQNYKRDYLPKENQDKYQLIGNIIKTHLKDDEVGFALTNNLQAPNVLTPQITYYAKRNIRSVNSIQEAKNWLNDYNRPKGRIFTLVDDYILVSEIEVYK